MAPVNWFVAGQARPGSSLISGLILMSHATIHSWFSAYPVRVEHIVWHWQQASSLEIERGMRWYADAQHVATVIARGQTRLGAGMLAVYSPQQAWIGNVLLAARVLRAGHGLGGPGSGVFASTAQRHAADRLLAGESNEDILTGPKVRDFASLIEHGGDRDPDPARARVVIDRHALSVACGRALTVAEYGAAPLSGYRRRNGSITSRHYDHVVQLFRHAADTLARHGHPGLAPHQIQAVCWLVRQRLNEQSDRDRSTAALDAGRATARRRVEQRWRTFQRDHFPHLERCPDTGYLAAA
jgi:hypothetical protein